MSDSYFKAPVASLDYTWDWGPWLAEVEDTISSATVVLSGGIEAAKALIVGETMVTQWASGGVVGEPCSMVCQITTVGGLVDERTIDLTIVER